MAESVVWGDESGKVAYGAAGNRDVLLIVSEDDVAGPDVVRRRAAIELTEEVRGKLENQGIPREQQHHDLSIVQARYDDLDKESTLQGVEISQPGEKLTRESVHKHIATLMNNCGDSAGVLLHYIGHGRRSTGDWCFQDGFITFTDLATLYLKLLRGRVLWIVSDCSHSGSWVRECMTFLDQQGVGPCGHSARDKGILIKVYTSCLSHQIPRQLALSVLVCMNDKNTGKLTFNNMNGISLQAKIADAQHASGLNFTKVRCGDKTIAEECLCLPQATWHTWSARNRIYKVNGTDQGKRVWRITLLVDDDLTILQFLEKVQGEAAGTLPVNPADYGIVLKRGGGETPPEDALKSALQNYKVFRDKLNLTPMQNLE